MRELKYFFSPYAQILNVSSGIMVYTINAAWFNGNDQKIIVRWYKLSLKHSKTIFCSAVSLNLQTWGTSHHKRRWLDHVAEHSPDASVVEGLGTSLRGDWGVCPWRSLAFWRRSSRLTFSELVGGLFLFYTILQRNDGAWAFFRSQWFFLQLLELQFGVKRNIF